MKVVLVLVLVLVLVRSSLAAPATARLAGQVLDPAGTPVAGATVTAESPAVARTTATAADGTFAFDDLLPGPYHLTATIDLHQPGITDTTVAEDRETQISLALGPARFTPPSVGPTQGALLSGLPLWSRSPPAALRLSLAARGRAGAHGRFAGAAGSPEWQLDNHDFTHPLTGAPMLAVGFEALAAREVEEVGSNVWGVGPRADLVLRAGSNRWDADATALGQTRAGAVEGGLLGPVAQDRLWFALSGQIEGRRESEGSGAAGRALAKLAWQIGARDKLSFVGAFARQQPESPRASFLGLRWESLLTEACLLSLSASVLGDDQTAAHPASRAAAGKLRLEYFLSTRHLGEHALTLLASGTRVTLDRADDRAAGRGHLRLEDHWQVTRSLTLAGGYGFTGAQLLDERGTVRGSSGELSVAWDATRDGRTVLRLRGSSWLVPGLVDHCPDCARSTRVDESAAGIEREVLAGTAAGVEVLLRRAHLAAATPTVEREALLAVHLDRRRQTYKLSLMYQGRLRPARGELLALGSLGLTSWLSAGAVVIRAPRSTWVPLFDETRAGPLGPAAEASGWLLGLQLHAELGAWLGVRSALWLDALNLAGDGGAVAVREGAPVTAPPRQLRLGLRVEY